MSLSIAFAGVVAGVIVWALLVRKLTTKSWETPKSTDNVISIGRAVNLAPGRIGLWTLLAVITSLFGLFITAYYMRLQHGQGAHGYGDWNSYPLPRILWLNSAVLILSGVAMQWARAAVRRGQRAREEPTLIAAGLLTCLFLVGQVLAWRQVSAAGFGSGRFGVGNPAIAFFYLLTAVHGLHLLGGLFFWGRTLVKMSTKGVDDAAIRLSVELCTVYWHYLLLVWLILFALLLST